MNNLTPTSPRRSVSLFPQKPVDEMDVLDAEQSAWEEQTAAAEGAVDRSKVIGKDGTINWWEALAPILAMGAGAVAGGSRGALVGGTAGAGYLQGRVEADERFRKQRQIDASVKQASLDRRMKFLMDSVDTLRKGGQTELAADALSKAMTYNGTPITKEDALERFKSQDKKDQQDVIRKRIASLLKEGTPESVSEATRLEIEEYETLNLRPATMEDNTRLLNVGNARIRSARGDETKKRVEQEKLNEDALRAKWERVESEEKAKKSLNPVADPADRSKALVTARGRIVERVIDQARRRATAEQLQAMTSAMQGAATPEESIAALLGKSLAKPEDFVQAYMGVAADAPSLLQWKNPANSNVETMPLEEVFAGESDILRAAGGGGGPDAMIDALVGSGDFDTAADENAVFEILRQSPQAAVIGESKLRGIAQRVWQKRAVAAPTVAPAGAPADTTQAVDPNAAFKEELRRLWGAGGQVAPDISEQIVPSDAPSSAAPRWNKALGRWE